MTAPQIPAPRQPAEYTTEPTVPTPDVVAWTRAVSDLLIGTVHLGGLPAPRYVTIGGLTTPQVGIQLTSRADVAAWAAWLGVEVSAESLSDESAGTLHDATGQHNGLTLKAYHVEYPEVAA